MPRISLIICTYNRADLLPRCLQAACAQTLDRSEYEVIAVDNGSSDHTRAIVERVPFVRYLYFPRRGLSIARNAGAHAARSPLLVYIDDDAIAAPDLLESHLRAFDAYPAAGCVGGRITLSLPPDLPAWYSDDFAAYYSAFAPPGEETRRVVETWEYPYGANVAFRREALNQAGYFSEHLGRIGRDQSGGEEIDAELRIARRGWEIYYNPRAVVQHIILPDRMRWTHVAKSARAAGRNWAYYETELGAFPVPLRADWDSLRGAAVRFLRGEKRYLARSQMSFFSAKLLRKLRYAMQRS